jgi:predicted flap endonuclease-1-like 5' DNA nuclease
MANVFSSNMQTENLSEKPLPEPEKQPSFSLDDIPEPPKFNQKKKSLFAGLLGKKSKSTEDRISKSPLPLPKDMVMKNVDADIPTLNIPPPPHSGDMAMELANAQAPVLPEPPIPSRRPKPQEILLNPAKVEDLAEPPKLSASNEAPASDLSSKDIPMPPPTLKTSLPNTNDIPLPPPTNLDKSGLDGQNLPPVQDLIPVKEDVPNQAVPSEEDAELKELLQKMKQEAPALPEVKEQEEVPNLPPLTEVDGIGLKREKELNKIGIDTIHKLADQDHEHIAKHMKIPKLHAKKIIAHAKKLSKKHKVKKSAEVKTEEQSIAELIKELEKEKGELSELKKSKQLALKGIPDVKGHQEIVSLLEELEKKKLELIDYENQLKDHESKLDGHRDKYVRDFEYLENLKRRVDHDIRERTQYLIDLEKDFYKKGQEIAKRQSILNLKEEELKKKVEQLSGDERRLRKLEHDLDDREITVRSKEKQLDVLTKELKRKDEILELKEQKIDKQEEHYEQRMDMLEKHEKNARRELEVKSKGLEEQLHKIKSRERELEKKQRVIDVEDRALDYAETEIETERQKLEEDEFQQYLHEKLGMVKETNVEIQDIMKAQKMHVPDLQDKPGNSIHDHIDSCKRMLQQNRVTEAKIFYNKARDKFYDINFKTQDDKESMHNVLRKLYDEINLKNL